VRAALALGCSLGDRRATLERTLRQLDALPGIEVVRVSRWVRTPPMRGGAASGWFLNGVALVHTDLSAHALLDTCIGLEAAAGRRRAKYWGDRPLDLDVLLVDDQIVSDERLQVPHPAIAQRRFVLGPLLEVWPDARDPCTDTPYASMPEPGGPRPAPIGRVARRQALRYL
jgi:2-amino-4-hydroxy-6-hydroxymethyldihydropteridine diphosphokinase